MTDNEKQRIGNYQLIRLLGKGGFAEVYLAEHIYLKTPAAIKLLQTKVNNQEDLEGFFKEAQTITQLVHPNIVRVLDFGLDGETPYLVMDYAAGGSLRQRHPRGRQLPLTMILPYVKQIAEALQYAHDQRIIHRDVKPENMLIGRHDAILLSDFGIALMGQSSRYQSAQEVAGTAAYMAPEQFQGHPHRASDQYALGVVVYEWLTGDRPFHGSFSEIASQHLFVSPPPLHEKVMDITTEIEQVVLTALEKDPQKRFVSVLAFATALEQVCLPTQHSPSVSPSQPLAPTVAAFPPTQLPWPAIATPPSNRPVQSDVITPQPVLSQPPKREITRRTALVMMAGLAVAGAGLTLLTLSRSPQASTSSSPLPTATFTPIPLGTTLYTYRGHSYDVYTAAWSPDGTRIASGGRDGTAQIWVAADGNHIFTYHGHSDSVATVAWSRDGKRIASTSADTTVQVWNAADGNHIFTYRGHSNYLSAVA